MIFGQLARERVQFNDITLWTGDDKVMGAYQPRRRLHQPAGARAGKHRLRAAAGPDAQPAHGELHAQRREVPREALASYPSQVIAVRLTADKRGQYTGSIELADMHDARSRSGRRKVTGSW
jgi:alpha-L-fucosidase 2